MFCTHRIRKANPAAIIMSSFLITTKTHSVSQTVHCTYLIVESVTRDHKLRLCADKHMRAKVTTLHPSTALHSLQSIGIIENISSYNQQSQNQTNCLLSALYNLVQRGDPEKISVNRSCVDVSQSLKIHPMEYHYSLTWNKSKSGALSLFCN